MPWKGVTVTEQRPRFLEDYLLNDYSITEPWRLPSTPPSALEDR